MKYLSSFWRTLQNFPLSLALILFSMTLLRLPNFFEPYWYGDEGIYLTIGNAMNRGSRLYAEIVDHKTPLIYYLATVGSQLNFRILLYFWMLVATTGFFFIAKQFLSKGWPVVFATTLFMLLTTLPWLEGNIPNGELFVMGFVIVSLWLLSATRYFGTVLKPQTVTKKHSSLHEAKLLFLSGVFASLGILTKVPALFDAAALFSIGYFGLLSHLGLTSTAIKKMRTTIIHILKSWLFIVLGLGLPILISILYFWMRGSGPDYLQFGLLYNFKYAGSWDLGITNPLVSFFFTLPGKILFLVLWFAALTGLKGLLTNKQLFIFGWFALAVVASLLSNRPYPHYFLQVVPPLALSMGILLTAKLQLLNKKASLKTWVSLGISTATLLMVLSLLAIMKVGGYPVTSYYANFITFSTGNMDRVTYFQQFNYLMKENYQIAALLKSNQADKIFIWGTNPVLYALSETRPVGRFTVSFHIEDLGLETETMEQLQAEQPEYIIVMKNQSPLPGLDSLLTASYLRVDVTQHMIVWKKLES